MLDFIKRLFGGFDSNGLRHSVKHLCEVEKTIGLMDIVQQAEYADVVTYNNANNIYFLNDVVKQAQNVTPDDYPKINATGIGNMAYLALYAPIPHVRQVAIQFLNKYKQWVKTQYPDAYGVGKIYSTNTRKRTLQRCKDGKFSTSKGAGSCSWHGGKGLEKGRGKQGDLFGDTI